MIRKILILFVCNISISVEILILPNFDSHPVYDNNIKFSYRKNVINLMGDCHAKFRDPSS